LSKLSTFFSLAAGVSDRLREARTRLGLKQVDLAAFGDISRATQVSYETGATEPTTQYLRGIESTGIDIPFILFGHDKAEFEEISKPGQDVNWTALQQAYESVEFFCLRVAPLCPARYRWQMVSQLYRHLLERASSGSMPVSDHEANEVISQAWASYGRS